MHRLPSLCIHQSLDTCVVQRTGFSGIQEFLGKQVSFGFVVLGPFNTLVPGPLVVSIGTSDINAQVVQVAVLGELGVSGFVNFSSQNLTVEEAQNRFVPFLALDVDMVSDVVQPTSEVIFRHHVQGQILQPFQDLIRLIFVLVEVLNPLFVCFVALRRLLGSHEIPISGNMIRNIHVNLVRLRLKDVENIETAVPSFCQFGLVQDHRTSLQRQIPAVIVMPKLAHRNDAWHRVDKLPHLGLLFLRSRIFDEEFATLAQ